jgi:hypothetical protein
MKHVLHAIEKAAAVVVQEALAAEAVVAAVVEAEDDNHIKDLIFCLAALCCGFFIPKTLGISSGC